MAREPAKFEYKLPGRTVADVAHRFNDVCERMRRRYNLKFGGRKASGEAFTNALVLYFLDLPEADQDAMILANFARYDAMVHGGEPPGAPAPAPVVTVKEPPAAAGGRRPGKARPKSG
jgi:hypothetical protein